MSYFKISKPEWYLIRLALVLSILGMVLTGALFCLESPKPNPMVIEAQQAFDRVMAGEEVPLADIQLVTHAGPAPFIDVWCQAHGLEGDAAQQKRDELHEAYQRLKVRLGEPVAEAESTAEEK